MAFGEGKFWLQFVPVLGGVAWFAAHWHRHRRTWDWGEQVPWLLLVSFVTSPYGAWHFDLVLLLVPLIHRAVRLTDEWTPVAVYVAANVVMLVLVAGQLWSFWFAWVAPVVLVLYAATARRAGPTPRVAVAPA